MFAALGLPFVPPELREAPTPARRPRSSSSSRSAATCTSTRPGPTARRACWRWPRPGARWATSTWRSATTRPNVRRRARARRRRLRRQGEEIAAANELVAPFRVLRGIECDILPDGTLDLPDDVLAELDWVQASVHAGQRAPGSDHEARRRGAAAPERLVPQPSEGADHQPPPGERAGPRARVRGRAGGGQGGRGERPPGPARPPRRARAVAVEAGVPIVCSTDAHSIRGLGNMRLAVATARRGGATAAAVVNTRPLADSARLRGAAGAASSTTRAARTSASRGAPRQPRIGVPGVEDVALEVAADRDVAERDVRRQSRARRPGSFASATV